MKKAILTSFTILLAFRFLFPQSNSIVDFLPLNVGNIWVYYYNETFPYGGASGFDRYKIISTYSANGKTYFKFVHLRVVLYGSYGWQSRLFRDTAALRIDSISGNIYRNKICGNSQVTLIDSLNARIGDSSFTCDLQGTKVVCYDTSSLTYFGTIRSARKFNMTAFEGYNTQTYAKNLGLIGFFFNQLMENCTVSLRGCIIDSVLYGDTNMVVGLNNLGIGIPSFFSLHQNYPNPFNPVTRIKFDIPPVGQRHAFDVQVIIYDILGREVAVLVNEQLKPGTYEVEWDGTDYPSGVYFYKLIAADYIDTKRMVLVK